MMFDWLKDLLGWRRRGVLICMRLDDMILHHPEQDNRQVCERCGHRVGIYPSGQQALRDHPGCEIVCSMCLPPSGAQRLAPGAGFREASQSRRRADHG